MGKKSKRRRSTTKIKPHHDSVVPVVVDSTDPNNLSLPTMIDASIRCATDKVTYGILEVLEKVCREPAVYLKREDMDSLMASIQTNSPIMEEVHSLREEILFLYCYMMIQNIDFYKLSIDQKVNKFMSEMTNRNVQNAATNSDHHHNGATNLNHSVFPVTEGDKKFLRTIIQNKDNKGSLFVVAHATLVLAQIEIFVEKRQSEGLHLYQEHVKLCKQISDEEKQQPLPLSMSVDDEDIDTVGGYLDYRGPQVQFTLHRMVLWANTVFGDNVGKGMLPGGICDGCGVPHEEGTAPFQVCSRCKKSYYCCKACQLEDWKHHKKNHCRKPGEFCIGDKVLATGEGIFYSDPGVVVAQAENTQEVASWLVAFAYGRTKQAIVPSTKLRVMQPSELRFQKALEALADCSDMDLDRINKRFHALGVPVLEKIPKETETKPYPSHV